VVADEAKTMLSVTGEMGLPSITAIPNRPAISNVLLKASANAAFRMRLLTDPQQALAEMNVPPEDIEVLAGVTTPSLREYARQVKLRLMIGRLAAERPSN
jgi:hypothetical protein